MVHRPRILVVGAAESDMQKEVLKYCPEEQRIHVALADTHRRLERLAWRTGKNWLGKKKKIPRLFDVACIDASIDLRDEHGQPESPMKHAVALAESGTSVLVYSPLYTGVRLQKLQEMIEDDAFIGVFDPRAIPEAAQLYLQEPKVAKRFIMLLKAIRWAGQEALEEKKALQTLLESMSEKTRELCMRILAREEEGVRLALA